MALHLGFLFSSPLILKSKSGNREIFQQIPLLSFGAESNLIKEAALQSGKNIKFLRSVATLSNFIEMLNRQPRALHISCHGIKNS